jgi:hypothetical protein
MSTKISFFLSFLLSSLEMGFWIAVEETVLDLKILGTKEDFLIFFFSSAGVLSTTGSLTMKGRMASVVTD